MPTKINFNPPPGQGFPIPQNRVASIDPPKKLLAPERDPKSTERKRFQGKTVGSTWEANFLVAIEKDEEIERFRVQPTFSGGRGIPGSFTPDVIFYISGIAFPCWIDGEYWHRTAEQQQRDDQQRQELDEILKDVPAVPAQRIPGSEAETLEKAEEALVKAKKLFYLTLDANG